MRKAKVKSSPYFSLQPSAFSLLGVGCLLFLNGCAIGPSYKRPAIDSPGNFRGDSDTVSSESIANRPWWDVYKDDSLKGLIVVGDVAVSRPLKYRPASSGIPMVRK